MLAVAYRNLSRETTFSKTDEHDLTLVGFVAFADPPREDAQAMLAAMKREGVTVKV